MEKTSCYDNQPKNCESLGRLYPWDQAMEACPEGWHLPTFKEFRALILVVGANSRNSKMLRSKTRWDGNDGTDDYGFSAIPAGILEDGNSYYWWGHAHFWTAETYGMSGDRPKHPRNYIIMEKDPEEDWNNWYHKSSGLSVRCIKDNPRIQFEVPGY